MNNLESKSKLIKVAWGIDNKRSISEKKNLSQAMVVKYIYSDGSEEWKIGGSKAWRNNNPGNVGFSPMMQRRKARCFH